MGVPHQEDHDCRQQNPTLWLIQVLADSFSPPSLSIPFRPYDTMKSFIWFTTVLFLCIELAHAAHLAPVHAHRQHKRTPSTPRGPRRRANRTCKPPTNTSDSDSQITTASSGGFPSLGFAMPDSVPSSLDGWWSDYTSEVGFLGFSYAVSGCTSLGSFCALVSGVLINRCDFQARVQVL